MIRSLTDYGDEDVLQSWRRGREGFSGTLATEEDRRGKREEKRTHLKISRRFSLNPGSHRLPVHPLVSGLYGSPSRFVPVTSNDPPCAEENLRKEEEKEMVSSRLRSLSLIALLLTPFFPRSEPSVLTASHPSSPSQP